MSAATKERTSAKAEFPPSQAALPVRIPQEPGNQRDARFTPEQIELIKRTIAKGATDDELQLFLHQCERTGLDPFARQIYFIKRRQYDSTTRAYVEIGQTQVSIDGFRLIAERSEKYAGQKPVQWCGADGNWVEVWTEKGPPVAARVGILRRDFDEPLFAVGRFDAYKQTTRDGGLNSMWAKMGAEQLAKCTEALALRKAFPQELSGLYTSDEMAQADNVPEKEEAEPERASTTSTRKKTEPAVKPEAKTSWTLDEAEKFALPFRQDKQYLTELKLLPTSKLLALRDWAEGEAKVLVADDPRLPALRDYIAASTLVLGDRESPAEDKDLEQDLRTDAIPAAPAEAAEGERPDDLPF